MGSEMKFTTMGEMGFLSLLLFRSNDPFPLHIFKRFPDSGHRVSTGMDPVPNPLINYRIRNQVPDPVPII